MASTSYFANTLAVTITTAAGSTLTVGILGGVEVNGEFEHKELYGQESVFREDVARFKAKVAVKAKFSKFHPKILGAILGTEEEGTDIDGGASATTTRASITDSNTTPLFNLRGTVTGKNGESLKIQVFDVYFENMPLPFPEDDFVGPELSGFGVKAFLEYVST